MGFPWITTRSAHREDSYQTLAPGENISQHYNPDEDFDLFDFGQIDDHYSSGGRTLKIVFGIIIILVIYWTS